MAQFPQKISQHWCYTDTECNDYTQMVHPVTIHQCLVVSQLEIPTLVVRLVCRTHSNNDAVHAISAAIDSQQTMHPIRPFAGCPSCRLWLRSNSHADRMQKSHAARSQSRHRTFVTEVNTCAQLVILTVRFASFLHPASLRLLHKQQRRV